MTKVVDDSFFLRIRMPRHFCKSQNILKFCIQNNIVFAEAANILERVNKGDNTYLVEMVEFNWNLCYENL